MLAKQVFQIEVRLKVGPSKYPIFCGGFKIPSSKFVISKYLGRSYSVVGS